MNIISNIIRSIFSIGSVSALAFLLVILMTGCDNAPSDDGPIDIFVTLEPESLVEGSENVDGAYPAGSSSQQDDVSSQAYTPPTIEGLQPDPPSPDISLPTPEQDFGVIGGVLIREVIDAGGYLPVVPNSMYLGELVYADNGTPVYVRRNDASPRAELFETGVFLFNNVPPGQYGLIIDLGFTEQILTRQDGSDLIVMLEPGGVLDLGQVYVTLSEN